MNCAKCGRRFFLHSPVNALWCDKDRVFTCGKCAVRPAPKRPPQCPFCRTAVSNSLPVAFSAVTIALVFSLVFASIFYVEATYRQGLASTPQANISQLVAGSTVMIVGQIASPSSPTLSAVWVASGKSGHWEWSANDFTLYQGSNAIFVDVSNLGNAIFGAPYEGNSYQYYYPGDSAAVVGTVSGSNTSWTLHAQAVSTSPSGFIDPIAEYAWIGSAGIAALSVAGVIYGYRQGLIRLKAHEARARQPGMFDYQPPLAADPPT
ncbi:MAG: hypothetical protein L3K17_07040 [Thermoplasmata archaeon]|nr:hypothetical protein [Thermoplasmata archaeon]